MNEEDLGVGDGGGDGKGDRLLFLPDLTSRTIILARPSAFHKQGAEDEKAEEARMSGA